MLGPLRETIIWWILPTFDFDHILYVIGESGVGKSAIIKHMLKKLGKDGGTSYKSGTILGSIFNFTDKNQALLDNISSLTNLSKDSGGENLHFSTSFRFWSA